MLLPQLSSLLITSLAGKFPQREKKRTRVRLWVVDHSPTLLWNMHEQDKMLMAMRTFAFLLFLLSALLQDLGSSIVFVTQNVFFKGNDLSVEMKL